MLEKLFDFALSLFKDPVYQPYSFGILIFVFFLFTYEKSKSIGLFEDIQSVFRSKKNQLKKLNERYKSELYSTKEKELIKYDIKVLEYQILLNSKTDNLALLIFLNGYINPKLATSRYNKSSSILKFIEDENIIVELTPSELKAKSKITPFQLFFNYIMIFAIASFFSFLADTFRQQIEFLNNGYARDTPTLILFTNSVGLIVLFVVIYILVQSARRYKTAKLLLKMDRKNEA